MAALKGLAVIQSNYNTPIYSQYIYSYFKILANYLVFSEIPVVDDPSGYHVCLIMMTFRAVVRSGIVTQLWFHLSITCSIMYIAKALQT